MTPLSLATLDEVHDRFQHLLATDPRPDITPMGPPSRNAQLAHELAVLQRDVLTASLLLDRCRTRLERWIRDHEPSQ
jgi:hypothetical protein